MANDDGQGFDYPLAIKDDFAIFDIGDSLVMRKRYHGDVQSWKKNDKSDELINELVDKHGWERVILQ